LSQEAPPNPPVSLTRFQAMEAAGPLAMVSVPAFTTWPNITFNRDTIPKADSSPAPYVCRDGANAI
jgi:hypothetical protein